MPKSFKEKKKRENKKPYCNCACHDQPKVDWESDNPEDIKKVGLHHDIICCSKMNGSLTLTGVEKLKKDTINATLSEVEKKIPKKHIEIESNDEQSKFMSIGHNSCLQQVQQIIKSMKED